MEKAKVHFEKGVELFKNDDYEAALVEFKAAYRAKPHYAVRYNIGICLYKLHRYGEANVELGAYLAEGGDDVPAAKKEEVESIMRDIDQLLGTLKVECDVEGATLLIDGEPRESWLLRVDVGEHEVKVVAEGHEGFETVVEVPGGEIVKVDAHLVPLEPKKDPEGIEEKDAPPSVSLPEEPVSEPTPGKPVDRSAFWSMFGVTGALALAAAITGGLAIAKDKEYQELTYEDGGWEAVREEGRRLTIATDVLLGMVSAAGVTTLVLAFFTDFEREKVDVAISLAPGSLSTLVEVSF
jgi:hypothetical protein